MNERIIGAYRYKHFGNKGKIDKILQVLKEYRKTAKYIAKIQWYLFFKQGSFNEYNDVKNIKSKLSERYKQTCQSQVVGILKSYISNRQNDFVEIVYNSSLDSNTKFILFVINKSKAWFNEELKVAKLKDKKGKVIKELPIDKKHYKLARKIIKHTFDKNKFPSFKNISMNLDKKVMDVQRKKEGKAKSYDYWVSLATLKKRRPVYIPLKANSYAEKLDGKFLNFIQVNEKDNDIEIRLVKELNKKEEYIPQTDIISIDIGLNPLFATDKGDLFGRYFKDYLIKLDSKITKRMQYLQKKNIRARQDKKYREMVQKLRDFLKSEINRIFNRIIDIYKPKVIVLEKLDLRSPDLSKRLNRLISNFGKRYINEKIERIKQLYGIEFIFINPAYTSQECSNCGYIDKENRKDTQTFGCKACGNKINAQVNGARNISKRSSLRDLITPYTSKKKVLQILVKQYLERPTGCNSAPWELLMNNPYYRDYISNSKPLMRREKCL